MKFNINLDWAVITSIFTLFLFWCGYWYFSGFASFYNYEIDIFNLPLSQLLITGLTIGVNYVVYLICEPYRVCRRVNILRDYPDDKIKIYP